MISVFKEAPMWEFVPQNDSSWEKSEWNALLTFGTLRGNKGDFIP